MRFDIVMLISALQAFAFFPEGSCDRSSGEENIVLRKRNEEASWLLKQAEGESLKLRNQIEVLSRRAEGLELTNGLGKVDTTQGYKPSETGGVLEGVGYSVAWGSDESIIGAASKQKFKKNGNLKITVNEFDKNGKKVSTEKRNEIKEKVEAKLTGNIFG